MMKNAIVAFAAFGLILAAANPGFPEPLAKNGWARVIDVSPHGAMLIQYSSGKVAWKRINPDNLRKDTVLAFKNRFVPARYVETKRGSTLTFPRGETLIYYELHLE
jgi:hypothetical protein